MMLQTITAGHARAALASLDPQDAARIAFYLGRARAPKTLRAREYAWGLILDYCYRKGARPIPMEVEHACGLFADLADRSYSRSVIENVHATLTLAHLYGQQPNPNHHLLARDCYRGVLRSIGDLHPNAKWALHREDLAKIAPSEPMDERTAQEWAIMLVIYWCAPRVESVSLMDHEHVADDPHGPVVIFLPRSKNDPDREGRWPGPDFVDTMIGLYPRPGRMVLHGRPTAEVSA